MQQCWADDACTDQGNTLIGRRMALSFRDPAWVLKCVVMLVLLTMVAGCVSSSDISLEREETGPVLEWPLPPEPPRIRYLTSIVTPQKLGMRKSFFKRVAEFLTGKKDERLHQPYGIAVDHERRIYIADSASQVVHLFDLERGRYRTIQGAKHDAFRAPVGLALDAEGRLYVSDVEHRAVFGLNPNGKSFVKITEGLQRPAGLAYNPKNGLLYVVDTLRHAILAYDREGRLKFSFGARGIEAGQFNYPTNITIDRQGILYVTDSMNFRVQIFQPDGTFMSRFGRQGDALGDFARPKGISVDSEGHIYVVEGLYDVVNVFNKEGRLLLTFGSPGIGPGEFWLATGILIDGENRIYVADSFNSRVQVFQYLKEAS